MDITATTGLASLAATGANVAPAATNAQATQVLAAVSDNSGGDTVQLTVAQQVYQLYNQGQQVSQIAADLNLSVAAVNSYLNVTSSSAGS
jgi:DNA-binding NarL/FixJ family response regulator